MPPVTAATPSYAQAINAAQAAALAAVRTAERAQGPTDAVYAVCHSRSGKVYKLRVSDELSWGDAQDRWDAMDTVRRQGSRPVALNGTAGLKVSWYCVRSLLDPHWPASGPKHPICYPSL